MWPIRAILLACAIPPAALFALGAYRLWEAIQIGWVEGIQRGLILCGALSASFIVAGLMTRSVWRRRK